MVWGSRSKLLAMKRPLRPCKEFGCKRLVKRGYCELHIKKHHDRYKESNSNYDRMRLSSRQRGYDTAWHKFRSYYLRLNPICVRCGAIATLIHHIKPLPTGEKYEHSNLQALCIKCHNKIHHRHNTH